MADEKKTRGKSQLGKGRWSTAEHKRQVSKAWKGGVGGPGWAVSDIQFADEDVRDRKEQKRKSGTTTRWSKSRIAKENASITAGETKAKSGGGETKAQKAAATSALNIEESKRKGTYTGKASKLKQKVKVKSRGGAAGFNPKLGRYSPTDIVRAGRGQIPKKKM